MQRRLYFLVQIYVWYSKLGQIKILEVWVSEGKESINNAGFVGDII